MDNYSGRDTEPTLVEIVLWTIIIVLAIAFGIGWLAHLVVEIF